MADLHVPGYDVGDLLGFGASGEVWAARDRVTHAAVALKRVRAPDEQAQERLLREAALLQRVEHPHVVRLLDVLAVEAGVVLVLEHAAGGSLRRLLAARGRLAPGEVVTLLVPLAQALEAVHRQGVVHGDVTPANVLLAADGRPLLADLGVSQLLGVAPGDVDATPGYADPAVLAGGPPGPAADVHGLAATCWAALTGTPPYDVVGQRRRPWPPDPAAADLVALLERALAPESGDRPAAAELASEAFRAATAVPVQRPGLPDDVVVGADGEAATYRVRRAAPVPEEPSGRRRGLVRAGRRRVAEPGRRPGSGRRAGARRRAPGVRAGTPRARILGVRDLGVRRLLTGALALAVAVLAGLTLLAATSRPGVPEGAGPPEMKTGDVGAREAGPPVAGPREAGPRDAGSPEVGPAGWAAVLARLDARRAEAFARADPAALDDVYAAASPARARDRARLAGLVSWGQRAEGVRLRTVSVVLRAERADRVVLRVVDVLAPYQVRSVDTGQVRSAPGRGARGWRVTLRREAGGWRVYDVVAG